MWTDEAKVNPYQNDGNAKVWRRKGSDYDPKHNSLPMKHDGGGVLAWVCMAASRIGLFMCNDGSRRLNSEDWRKPLKIYIEIRPN